MTFSIRVETTSKAANNTWDFNRENQADALTLAKGYAARPTIKSVQVFDDSQPEGRNIIASWLRNECDQGYRG